MVNLGNDSSFFLALSWQQIYFLFIKGKCELQVHDYDRTRLRLRVLLEKIQSHPQLSAQKLCFGFSSPDILWKDSPNSQLFWQCFPGRCKHNFLKMFTLSDLAHLKNVSLPLCLFRKDRRVMRNVQIYVYMCMHVTN